jgi:hypothetical protein
VVHQIADVDAIDGTVAVEVDDGDDVSLPQVVTAVPAAPVGEEA